jgi:glycosyltransferase involved in cell wall biosynthesis
VRILFWLETFWPQIGGVEVNVSELAPLLRRRGHDVAIVATREHSKLAPREDYGDVPVHRFAMKGPLQRHDIEAMADTRGKLGALWRDFRPELVHVVFCFGPSVFFLGGLVRAGPSPVLLTLPGFVEFPTGPDTLLRNTFELADWTTAPSQAVVDHVAGLLPEIDTSSSVVPNGVDPPHAPAVPPPDVAPQVLFVGRLSTEKGCDVALAAFSGVLEGCPDARLVIAGDGPERGRLEGLATELGVDQVTSFAGPVSPARVWELYDRTSVVVVPSRDIEGFSLVAAEAALRERPVVASRIGGLPEVVADGETGLLVAPEDPDELAGALLELLTDRERASALGRAGALRARERFTIDRQADAFEDLYRRLASRFARQSASNAPGKRSTIQTGSHR